MDMPKVKVCHPFHGRIQNSYLNDLIIYSLYMVQSISSIPGTPGRFMAGCVILFSGACFPNGTTWLEEHADHSESISMKDSRTGYADMADFPETVEDGKQG
jgi:hypothetical protein